jgi:hypothetical protein
VRRLIRVACVFTLSAGLVATAAGSTHAATDRTGDLRLVIDNSNPCRAGRTVMQGMVAGPGGQLYIVFTGKAGSNPVLSRWTRSGSSWSTTSWICTGPPADFPAIGHGNDLAYHPNYGGNGPAILVTKGTQTSARSDDFLVVPLYSDGTIKGSAYNSTVDLPMDISGLCYSATAGKYVARRLDNMWTHPSSGSLGSGWTLVNSNITSHANRADQGIDCSENNVWNTRSIASGNSDDAWNWVYQYNWSGKDVESDIGIPGTSMTEEIEDVTHIGDDFFISINRNDGASDLVVEFFQ